MQELFSSWVMNSSLLRWLKRLTLWLNNTTTLICSCYNPIYPRLEINSNLKYNTDTNQQFSWQKQDIRCTQHHIPYYSPLPSLYLFKNNPN